MLRRISLYFLAAFVLGNLGCGHIHKVEGPVEESQIPTGFQVGIGANEVKAGERVTVSKQVCKSVYKGRAGKRNECRYTEVGHAMVLKVLDHDSAIVQPEPGLTMDSSMRVEKVEP